MLYIQKSVSENAGIAVIGQWRSQGGARGGDRPPNRKKKHSLKKAKSVERLGGGVHVTSPKLKLIKYIATKENDDILEEHDL